MKKSKNSRWIVLLFPISMILLIAAKYIPDFCEQVYTKYVYHVIAWWLNSLTGWIPFSVMEWEWILFLFALSGGMIWWLIHFVQGKGKRKHLLVQALWKIGKIVSVAFFLFTLTCGLNYYRYPFSSYRGLTLHNSTKEELYELCHSLTIQANELRKHLSEDEKGIVKLSFNSYREMADVSKRAMSNLAKQYPVLAGNYGGPKPMLFSEFMSRMELTGIFWGFTMEANINTKVTEYTIPATMCHELSHLRGFMREEEANYIAYMACLESDHLEFQYSGIMLALVYTGNQLYHADKELFRKVKASYSEEVKRDFREDSAYWEPYENTKISKLSNRINDTYLKANNQSDGVKSYGRMVDLLLAEYKEKK